jgi:hypothetical protein
MNCIARVHHLLCNLFNKSDEAVAGQKDVKVDFNFEFDGRAYLYRNGTASLGITFNSSSELTVEKLFLMVGNQESQALNWKPITFNGSRSQLCKFDIAGILKTIPETHLRASVLIAVVQDHNYRSPIFDISGLII